MSPSLSDLLNLPPGERAELAMALWESLSNAEREAALELTAQDVAELDSRKPGRPALCWRLSV
jgi:putative addiction module component (TIGR02574 family)